MTSPPSTTVKPPNTPTKPIEEEKLVDCIRKISRGFESLSKSGLNQHAIVVLLQDQTKLGRGHITNVLTGLRNLERVYCK